MLDEVSQAVSLLRSVVCSLDAAHPDASRLLTLFAEAERLCASAVTVLSTRLPAPELARVTGTSEGQARAVIETAERLRDLPATDAAFRSGELSLAQVAAVTDAASVDPDAEAALLSTARAASVRELREQARRVKAAAEVNAMGVYERQHKNRSFRHGVDDEGMVWGHFRLPPDTGAAVVNLVEGQADRVFRAASREGRREPHHAYAADALVTLVTGAFTPRSPRAEVVVVVDHEALVRGHTQGSERCEVRGFGAVPVPVARRLLADAFLKGVLVEGTEVRKVRHFGRHIPEEVRTALELRDPCCRVSGCGRTQGLEWDHVVPFAEGGPTAFDNLQALCAHHHGVKTRGRCPP